MTAPPQFPLKSKVAIVTGGTRGIGRAISLHLASLGASVLIVHSDPSRAATASSTVSEIQKANSAVSGSAASVCADLRDLASSKVIVDATLKAFNTDRIDILINNAAIADFTPTEGVTPEIFDDIISVDLKGPLFLTQEVVKHMPSGGRIVNISSVLAKNNIKGQTSPIYSASKAAMDSLTRTWAAEWGKSKGITINSVSVGPTMTDMARSLGDEYLKNFVDTQASFTAAAARLGEPDDIAQIVGFLAGEGSRWVTGSTIGASGGMFFD